MWTACANLEPVVGEAKAHEETLLFPDECTHFFEGPKITYMTCQPASYIYQHHRIANIQPVISMCLEDFCVCVSKFSKPFSLARLGDALDERFLKYAKAAAYSRTYQISDGAYYWKTSVPSTAPPVSQKARAAIHVSRPPRPPGQPK
jgi:hypothetical protein